MLCVCVCVPACVLMYVKDKLSVAGVFFLGQDSPKDLGEKGLRSNNKCIFSAFCTRAVGVNL